MFITFKRISDGLLKNQREIFKALTDQEKASEAASLATLFSGSWEHQTLSAAQFGDCRVLQVANRAAYLVNGNVVSKPILTASLDKTSILANDTDKAVLTINVNDGNFTGNVVLWLNPPETAQVMYASQAVAGVATFEITTEQEGVHELLVDVHEYGLKELTLEGVE